ncbi:hypothetical protein ACH4EC_15415 [Streptomyces anulatus]
MPLTIQLLLAIALLVLVAGASLALSFAFSRPRASRERIRALSGLLAVLGSNAAIVLVAIWGANKLDTEGAIGVLTAAFTAVSTMTTAYLGIKAVSNTAKKLTSEQQDEDSNPEGADGTAMIREQTASANALKEAATATADAANAAVNAANAARRACEEAKEMAANGAVKRRRTEKGPRRAKQFGRSWRSRTR